MCGSSGTASGARRRPATGTIGARTTSVGRIRAVQEAPWSPPAVGRETAGDRVLWRPSASARAARHVRVRPPDDSPSEQQQSDRRTRCAGERARRVRGIAGSVARRSGPPSRLRTRDDRDHRTRWRREQPSGYGSPRSDQGCVPPDGRRTGACRNGRLTRWRQSPILSRGVRQRIGDEKRPAMSGRNAIVSPLAPSSGRPRQRIIGLVIGAVVVLIAIIAAVVVVRTEARASPAVANTDPAHRSRRAAAAPPAGVAARQRSHHPTAPSTETAVPTPCRRCAIDGSRRRRQSGVRGSGRPRHRSRRDDGLLLVGGACLVRWRSYAHRRPTS